MRSSLAALALSLSLGSGLWPCGSTQAQEARAQASNPIIWADVPDLAVIRVGDTYYMSSTTMHMSPGLPIMKSKDLVNWHFVGYAYDILEDDDALTLRNGKNAYGKGSWASSLRLPRRHLLCDDVLRNHREDVRLQDQRPRERSVENDLVPPRAARPLPVLR